MTSGEITISILGIIDRRTKRQQIAGANADASEIIIKDVITANQTQIKIIHLFRKGGQEVNIDPLVISINLVQTGWYITRVSQPLSRGLDDGRIKYIGLIVILLVE